MAAGGFFATSLAGATPSNAKVAGWRVAFYTVAAVSCALSGILLLLGREPRPRGSAAHQPAPLSLAGGRRGANCLLLAPLEGTAQCVADEAETAPFGESNTFRYAAASGAAVAWQRSAEHGAPYMHAGDGAAPYSAAPGPAAAVAAAEEAAAAAAAAAAVHHGRTPLYTPYAQPRSQPPQAGNDGEGAYLCPPQYLPPAQFTPRNAALPPPSPVRPHHQLPRQPLPSLAAAARRRRSPRCSRCAATPRTRARPVGWLPCTRAYVQWSLSATAGTLPRRCRAFSPLPH